MPISLLTAADGRNQPDPSGPDGTGFDAPVSTRDLRSRESADSDHSQQQDIIYWESLGITKAFVDFISAFVFSVSVIILTGEHTFSLDQTKCGQE